MVESSSESLHWVKKADKLLLELENMPLFGLQTPFHWGRFEKELRNLFSLPHLSLKHEIKGWGQFFTDVGEDCIVATVEWVPLNSPVYFVVRNHDIKNLTAELLNGEKSAAYFYDIDLCRGFYFYFATEMLRLFEKIGFAAPLSPRVVGFQQSIGDELRKTASFGIDVSVSLNEQNFWGRVILPKGFGEEWSKYFAKYPAPPLSDEAKERLFVDLSLEIGHTLLNLKEWQEVCVGDFILLDHCSYDPTNKRGWVVVMLNQKPLFRGRFKEGGIHLTEYPEYEEVDMAAEEEEEFPEGFQENKETVDVKTTKIDPEDVTINLSVEVGRVRMTAKELMSLSPGSLLPLNVSPEHGVDLIINGKKVGRGELIRLGETLGVRVLFL